MANIHLTDSGLPPRVREIVADLLAFCRLELASRIELSLDQLDIRLYRQADQARDSHTQTVALKARNSLRDRRSAFAEAYFAGLEARLSALRRPGHRRGQTDNPMLPSSQWAIEDRQSAEDSMTIARLRELCMPLESTSSLPLYLLGQRFGVLAAMPAFSADQIVIGPRPLLDLSGEIALHLFSEFMPMVAFYEEFAHHMLGDYAGFVDRANTRLEESNVLRGLAFVPARLPKAARRAGIGILQQGAPGPEPLPLDEDLPEPGMPGAEPVAAEEPSKGFMAMPPARVPMIIQDWMEQPAGAIRTASLPGHAQPQVQAAGPQIMAGTDFRHLQQLLTAHRIAGQPVANAFRPPSSPAQPPALARGDIEALLDAMQVDEPAYEAAQEAGIMGMQAHVLAHAQDLHGPEAGLGREDADAFEILALLYAEVAREVRGGSPVLGLLARLQLPLLRLVLQDRSFFDVPEHPARLLLNAIAESDATIYNDHPVDPYFETIMQRVVSRLESGYRGQSELIVQVNEELQNELQQQVRRAQANERRLVEAANGRERMILAKRTAADTLNSLMRQSPPPERLTSLLRHAWLDALTLAVLRNGEDSNAWHSHIDMTRHILQAVSSGEGGPQPELAGDIEAAMRRVGYHGNEAVAIACHLSRPDCVPAGDDMPDVGELTDRIRNYARFGTEDENRIDDDMDAQDAPPRPDDVPAPVLAASMERLLALPFGTWLDCPQEGRDGLLRRRLSWFSTETGRALMVNRRGQRVTELPLADLARQMATRQAFVVEPQDIRLVDRAMRATAVLLQNSLRVGARGPFSTRTQ